MGELWALRWADVDLATLADRHGKASALHVQTTLRYINGDTYFFSCPRRRRAVGALA